MHRNAKPEVVEMAREIVRREGGLVDDPRDKGGITNYGVSLRYARGRGLDLNGDGVVDGADILLVTPEKAVELFLEDFYFDPRIHDLPEVIQEQTFDSAVNHGAGRAIKFVQLACNDLRYLLLTHSFDKLRIDGGIGPKTLGAAHAVCLEMGVYVNTFIARERQRFYLSLCVSDPSQRRFIDGWLKRAEEFVADDDA